MFTARARLLAIASLLLTCLIVDIAAAQKPRSAADRRQRPNAGFWDNSSASRSSSRSTWSNPMSFSAPRAYASQGSVTTGNYAVTSNRYVPGTIASAPRPQYSVVPGQTVISSGQVASNPVVAGPIVSQPVPPQAGTPVYAVPTATGSFRVCPPTQIID